MLTRYLIRCDHTGRLLSWSHDAARAFACARGLRARLTPCFVEITR